MPRSNRPRRRSGAGPGRTGGAARRNDGQQASAAATGRADELDRLLGLDPGYRHESAPDGGWHVRRVPAWRAVKDYTCPGCGRTIPPGLAHVVAWRSDWIFGDEAAGAERRHWHPKCWGTRRQDGRYR